ncbi:MAG: DUF421 domain-containing protein [Nevskiaceae bacterium]|nr:MAG: DUF421 domain-containing protein [Nevskiaceae bacterium]
MDHVWHINWQLLLVPNTSLAEVAVRGTVIYMLLFFIMRFMRREAGQIGLADVLIVVVIADAAQNAMAGPYNSLTEGVVLIAVITFWDFTLDWLGYHWAAFGRLIHPQPLPLIIDGHVLWRNLRRELITEAELRSRLREEGIEHPADVKRCFMEGDGRISIIGHDGRKRG